MKGDLKPISPSVVAHSLQALGHQAQVCCSLESSHWIFFACKFKCRFLATSRRQQERKPVFLVLLRAGPTYCQYNQQGKIIHGLYSLKLCIKFSWPTQPRRMGCRHLWRIWYCVQWMLKTGRSPKCRLHGPPKLCVDLPGANHVASPCSHFIVLSDSHITLLWKLCPNNWCLLMKLFYSNISGHLYMSFKACFCMSWNMFCSMNTQV